MSEEAKLAAFVALDPTIAGLQLRPLSAGSLILLRLTKNPLINGETDAPDAEFHIAAFLFIHSAEPATVRRVAAHEAAFRDAVIEFADTLTIADFVKAATQIKSLVEAAALTHDYEVKSDGTPRPNH